MNVIFKLLVLTDTSHLICQLETVNNPPYLYVSTFLDGPARTLPRWLQRKYWAFEATRGLG